MQEIPQEAPPPGPGAFVTTRWSVVAAAIRSASPAAESALESLCRAYWAPIYQYVLRTGHSPEDACDLTQSFFYHLLAKGWLAAADKNRGRFRTFLLSVVKHFLADEWDRMNAQKRGGGKEIVSLEKMAEEQGWEPPAAESAEQAFDRRWAVETVERALERIRAEWRIAGRESDFGVLQVYLAGGAEIPAYAVIARELGMSEPAVRMAVSRLRKRFGEILRAEVMETVLSPAEADEELRYLAQLLAQ